MDQSPRFSTHVIRGLTDKFNHHRVKVYHLHVFWDSRSVFCAPHILARVQRERERRDSDNASMDGYIHKVVKIPVFASILVNTVGYVLI